ncbi:hypothetical protein NQZ68_018926 [Dissostichus eleginoides]|nr:hypothetical protein NQZ68_018926 [Dissostichus eleginoides]
METETGSPAHTGPPLSSSSSSSSSSFTLIEAPHRPSFSFSWLKTLHKKNERRERSFLEESVVAVSFT